MRVCYFTILWLLRNVNRTKHQEYLVQETFMSAEIGCVAEKQSRKSKD